MLRLLAAFLMLALPVAAQHTPLSEKRPVFEADTDFFGGDVRAIFDTTLPLCQSACTAEAACQAFTYNQRSAACFLKTGVDRRDPYEGALSAVMIPRSAEEMALARRRAAELSFLDPGRLDAARAMAQRVTLDHRGATDAEAALAGARAAAQDGDWEGARVRAAAAAARGDRADMWLEFSRAASAIPTDDFNRRRALRAEALDAAVNGYLRSADGPQQATAAERLSEALEAADRGRAALDAMRLALQAAPRRDLEAAVARLDALYGFRVIATRAETDGPSPRVCVAFSEPLVAGAIEYADYVVLPAGDFAVTANDRDLCVDGAAYGTRLRVTLREGLPSAAGEALSRAVEQSVYIRDRAPAVRFPSQAYVLPRTGPVAVPIVAVNTDTVEVAIHRVPEEGLSGVLQDGLVGTQLQPFEERRLGDQLGETVWSGTAEIETRLNEDVTATLPLTEAVQGFAPGVYALTARLPTAEAYRAAATQWFIVTDLGLSVIQGDAGAEVTVRSLGSAAALAGVDLALRARSGAVLAEAVSDAAGQARFDAAALRGTGGFEPTLLTATTGQDYAWLDLSAAPLDLSDRGVEGRAAPPPIDVFASTERGIYRPGDTVFATVLARDTNVAAIAGLPLTAVTLRPDGVEHDRQVLSDAGAGGRVFALTLPEAAQRGPWTLRLFADPEGPALTSLSYLVEDFVPDRIAFDLTLPLGPLDPRAEPRAGIDARYLYGAPGADLAIEGELRIAPSTARADWPGYVFGSTDIYIDPIFEPLPPDLRTDAEGRAELPLPLTLPESTGQPLSATLTVRLADASGRPVERQETRDVLIGAPLIGLRPLFDGAAPEGGTAAVEVIGLSAEGGCPVLSGRVSGRGSSARPSASVLRSGGRG
ncbi:MAG: MG2 domain-containing protein [Pseudomonadota bacterium]